MKRAYNGNGSICRNKKIYRLTFWFEGRINHKASIKLKATHRKEMLKVSGKGSSTFLISLNVGVGILSLVCL